MGESNRCRWMCGFGRCARRSADVVRLSLAAWEPVFASFTALPIVRYFQMLR